MFRRWSQLTVDAVTMRDRQTDRQTEKRGKQRKLILYQQQCDQINRFGFQYLAIYRIENLRPKVYKLCQSELKLCPKPNKPQIYFQTCSNICQSGGISPNLVTLINSQKTRSSVVKAVTGLLAS